MTNSEIALLVVLAALSYAVGNISPATLMGKVYGVDIRKEGSGNPGTTNVLRTLGKKAALCTLLIDILKGFIPVFAAKYIFGYFGFHSDFAGYVCGTAAFCGHIWPLLYRFKGGKGIATGFGVTLAIDWRIGVTCLLFAVLGAFLTKRMSCGSIAAALVLPVAVYKFQGAGFYVLWAACLAVIVILRHRSNIRRIIAGEEPSMSIFDKIKK